MFSLRLRVAIGFALLGGGVSVAFGSWVYLTSRDLDRRLVDDALTAEVQDYRARLARNPASLPPMTATLRGYLYREGLPDPRPGALRSLVEGRHEVGVDGASYRVAVVEDGGATLYMLHNRSQVAKREARLLLVIVGGIALTLVLSAIWGWWLAERVIAPVGELARRVRERPPTDLDSPFADGLPQDEVGELAHAFERYLARMRAFIERERSFSADASHELRTPLAVILGAVEVLQNTEGLDERLVERLERIERAARGMSDLIATLLTLARERPDDVGGTIACSVNEVVAEVVEQHRHILGSKPISLSFQEREQLTLVVERPLLAIAIGNLVRNAIIHTDEGTVTIVLEDGGLSVADAGRGISSEELATLFDRTQTSNRSARGVGIGLPLVRRIAARQGWSLSATNRPGGGAKFRIFFTSRKP